MASEDNDITPTSVNAFSPMEDVVNTIETRRTLLDKQWDNLADVMPRQVGSSNKSLSKILKKDKIAQVIQAKKPFHHFKMSSEDHLFIATPARVQEPMEINVLFYSNMKIEKRMSEFPKETMKLLKRDFLENETPEIMRFLNDLLFMGGDVESGSLLGRELKIQTLGGKTITLTITGVT